MDREKRLPPGLSYVLKTSQLEEALTGIDCPVHLVYTPGTLNGYLLCARYWVPNDNVPYARCHVTAGRVPSAVKSHAAAALSDGALSVFADWLREMIALPGESTRLCKEPTFLIFWDEAGLKITHS